MAKKINIDINTFQENFDKESKKFSKLSHKENHRRVSSPSKTIALNGASLGSGELFLLDRYSNIENIRSKNPNRSIIIKVNINSLRYKFNSLVQILHSNFDILLISETKIDSSLPTAQFKIEGYNYV